VTEARRGRVALERAVADAKSDAERARAEFELGAFHDRNSREAEAIPHYEAALEAGIDGEDRARCLAWLASSLYKTGRPQEAISRVKAAWATTQDAELGRFVSNLERRVYRSMGRRR